MPVYRESSYNFGEPPFYYKYMGMTNTDAASASGVVFLVFLVLLILLTAGGGHHQEQESVSMAIWVLLLSCLGLLGISLFACGAYIVAYGMDSNEAQ